jgi:hypothetical protein
VVLCNETERVPQTFSGARWGAPAFDRVELARWADEFRAGLPARREALAAQFQSALEAAGGVFHSVRDSEDAAGIALEIARAQAARRAVAWDDPALSTARAALEGGGIAVSLSTLPRRAAQVRAAHIAADIGDHRRMPSRRPARWITVHDARTDG